MAKEAVSYERDDGVGLITLARGADGNRMSPEILAGFSKRILEARGDSGLRCLVITGEGRSFCAGADLSQPLQSDQESWSPEERSYAMYAPFLSLLDVDVPVIGALNGHAIGGGFGLALLCDLRYARIDSKYGATFTRLGLHPGMAVTYLLPRLVGLSRASDWLYTARLFDGREGQESGLFNEALPAAKVLPRAFEVATAISRNGPIALRMTKESLRRGLELAPKEAAKFEARAQSTTIDTFDAKEGIAAALERRPPEFRGR
jgi:enoyl-CoA hydratase/carnithine racemase